MEINKILLDTNAYSNLLKGDKHLQETLENASIIYFSVVVIGELLAGFKIGHKEKQNRRLLDGFLNSTTVSIVDITPETADIYSEMVVNLKKIGKPIPMNDIWIAAQCMEQGAKLVTYDKHFYEIPGLRIWLGCIQK